MIPLLLVALSAAPAQSLDRYPWRATVTVPAGAEAARVAVPPALRQAGEPTDGSDLLLLGPDGDPVPAALLTAGEPQPVGVSVRPTADPDRYEIEPSSRILDGLTVSLGAGPAAARVWVEGPNGLSVGPVFVWSHPGLGQSGDVALPPTTGPLTVRLEHQVARPARGARIAAWQRASTAARPARLTLPVVDQRLTELGDVRYTVELPHSLPIAAVTPTVAEPFVDRQAQLLGGAVGAESWDAVGPMTALERVHLGAVALDRLTLDGPEQPVHDTLVLSVGSAGRPPLTIPEVTLELEGRELLLLAPEAGTYTLLAGAPAGTTPPADLQAALPEVAALPWLAAPVADVRENPDWAPPEVRAALAEPGPTLEVDRYAWQAPVTGVGLSRIPLPTEVLAHAQRDLADLRLVDAQGARVPHLVRRSPADRDTAGAPFTRTEEGGASLLRVAVPHPDVPLSTVTLRTRAPTFSRSVTLFRAAGAVLDPVRTLQWVGEDRPAALPVTVDRVVGDELLIRVENGDDAPLPIDAVDLSWPAWELVAALPEGGATLMFGHPSPTPPAYDLALLTDSLLPRAKAVATVGPVEARTPPPRSAADEAMLLLGIAVLVGGLLALTVQLVRGVPVAREEDEAAGDAADAAPLDDPPTDDPPAA